MRKLSLDYLAGEKKELSGLLILLCGLSLAAFTLWEYQELKHTSAKLEAGIAKGQRVLGRNGSKLRNVSDSQVQRSDEIVAANFVISRLGLPWDSLLGAFEQASSDKIALLGIEPDTTKRVVRVTAESRNAKDMLEYLKRLQRATFLDEIVLQRHEFQILDPERPLRFVVTGIWRSQ
jgi:hypothetical protein